jgi:hypothetical protein
VQSLKHQIQFIEFSLTLETTFISFTIENVTHLHHDLST